MSKKGVVSNLNYKSVLLIVGITIGVIALVAAAFILGSRYKQDQNSETNIIAEDEQDLSWLESLLALLDKDKEGDTNIDVNVESEDDDMSWLEKLLENLNKEKNETSPDDNGVVDDEVVDPDPIVACANDALNNGLDYSFYNLEMTGPICMGHAFNECDGLGKVVAEDFFEESLLCCEWDCSDEVADCADTDGGSNIWIKGSCTDENGVDTDRCSTGVDFTDFVDESWCEGDMCVGASFSCFNEGATCYDGMCVPDDQDSDGDGFTDLFEYGEGTNPNDDSDFPGEMGCTDTDSADGFPFGVRGICTDNTGAYEDYCVYGTVIEKFCDPEGLCAQESYWCGAEGSYCENGACVPATPSDCSGLCVLEGGLAAKGFCGDPAEITPWSDCVGSQGELGSYLFSPIADMLCAGEELPFNSCCCFPDIQ